MKRVTPRFAVILAVDVFLLGICLLHLPAVFRRPMAPFHLEEHNGNPVVVRVADEQSAGTLKTGDVVLSWEGKEVALPEAIEFLGDMGSIGSKIAVEYRRGGNRFITPVTLISYYPSPRFLVISFIVGLMIWGTGVLILWSAPPGVSAGVLHWTMIAFGVTILITPGSIAPADLLSLIERFLFFLSYGSVAALFFLFSLVYPRFRYSHPLRAGFFSFLPALVLVGGMSYLQLSDLWTGLPENFRSFQFLFDMFQISLFLYLGGAAFFLFRSLHSADSGEERKRLQWILWGIAIGTAPFLFLFVLPQLLFSQYVIAEEYATIFFLAIPFAWTMSFLKYHFLDIEVLINRSIVYTLLTIFMVVVYALIFFLATTAFDTHSALNEYLVVGGVALIIAFLFAPVKDRLQRIIDETLFTARVHFRSALRWISEDLQRCLTPDDLYAALAHRLGEVVPARTVAAFALEGDTLRRRGLHGEPLPEWIGIAGDVVKAMERSSKLLSVSETGPPSPEALWLRETGCTTSLSLKDERGRLEGLVILSPKVKGDNFREEEVDLLSAVVDQAAEVLRRLKVQERMFLDQEEKRRLQELSDLKSYFVSSVSHELRMPLTSIRMYAETLRLGRVSNRRMEREYLRIIEGESARLDRLIRNVLNFARIERGVREYRFGPVSPRKIAADSVSSLKYEFQSAEVRLRVSIAKKLPLLRADADALEEVLMNLLSNALKYSTGKGMVRFAVRARRKAVLFEVEDRGIGIPSSEIPYIFEKFYRVRDQRSQQVGGTGLGLPLVKHIVESHGGSVAVKSSPGKGSTFTVILPTGYEDHSSG